MRATRHDEKLVHIRRTCHDRLRPADDDAAGTALRHMHVDVGIDLLTRPLRTIAFGVGHRDAERQIFVLHAVEVIQETRVIVGAMRIVGAPGRLENTVQRIMRQITLGAAGLAAHEPHSLELAQEIVRRFVDVQHAVDGLAARALSRRHL